MKSSNIIKHIHLHNHTPYTKRNFNLTNYNKAISSLKQQITQSHTLLSQSASRYKHVNHSKLVSYPITITTTTATTTTTMTYVHSHNSTWNCSKSLSPLTTPRKCDKACNTEQQVYARKHKPKVNLLSFNKKLRMYIRDDDSSNNNDNNAFDKIKQKNIEEIYYDYDKNNQRRKKESFSGNNAKVLKNKILFVKGVMDYMVPRMLMNKMKYINQKKEQEFQCKKLQYKNSNRNNIRNVYVNTITSGNDKALSARFSINAVGRGGIINMKKLLTCNNNNNGDNNNCYKKILLNKNVVQSKIKNYNFY